ncbi:uncharacterized protein ASCRUDRAFT_74552 [Ascoidea rubescens DSM 1968]|uniref:C2H2-type domain-containing protein n=1 Tax=Ascoidea rubescens DSM 1968 TaxID=1344418 RepID=A0A1D2VNP4_9ASCO|nr:hypothetical protein ASCRUDRAFT_74552 [Ascoidea rubescens DSM 1968]ODV63175.1 hypothetical protein ASCRUDRAFT_74552 [Ascoidea rubescens DSM 1968]
MNNNNLNINPNLNINNYNNYSNYNINNNSANISNNSIINPNMNNLNYNYNYNYNYNPDLSSSSSSNLQFSRSMAFSNPTSLNSNSNSNSNIQNQYQQQNQSLQSFPSNQNFYSTIQPLQLTNNSSIPIQSNSSNQIFSCDYPDCDTNRRFQNDKQLKKHNYDCHDNVFFCTLCCDKFPRNDNCRRHVNMKHKIPVGKSGKYELIDKYILRIKRKDMKDGNFRNIANEIQKYIVKRDLKPESSVMKNLTLIRNDIDNFRSQPQQFFHDNHSNNQNIHNPQTPNINSTYLERSVSFQNFNVNNAFTSQSSSQSLNQFNSIPTNSTANTKNNNNNLMNSQIQPLQSIQSIQPLTSVPQNVPTTKNSRIRLPPISALQLTPSTDTNAKLPPLNFNHKQS